MILMSKQRPAILVNADSRDQRLYEVFCERGYRLFGFPRSHAHAVAAVGIDMSPVDLLESPEPRARDHATQITLAMHEAVAQALADPGFAAWHSRYGGASSIAIDDAIRHGLESLTGAGALAIEAFQLLCAREPIGLVLVRDDNAHPGKALVLAARQMGIPSLHVMHGTLWAPTTDSTINADVVAAFGPWTRDWYLSNGNDATRIAITGNPVWDGYLDAPMLEQAPAVRRQLRLDPGLPVVMYATTIKGLNRAADFTYWDWPHQHYAQAVRALGRLHRRRPIQLLVKLHPRDDPAAVPDYIRLAEQAGLPVRVIRDGWADPRHIAAADLLVCSDSTIGIEAMLLNRPVVSLQLGQPFPLHLYDDQDGVVVVRDRTELAGAFETALFDDATQALLAERRIESVYRFNYLNDGRAGERVAQLVESLLDPARADAYLAEGAPAALRHSMSVPERQSVAWQHVLQSRTCLEQGRSSRAWAMASHALALVPDMTVAHFLRGHAALQRGDAHSALVELTEATRQVPDNVEYLNTLAAALDTLGQTDEVEAVLRRALALDTQHLNTLANLAILLEQSGQLEEAQLLAERASRVSPDDSQVNELLERLRRRPV